MEQSIYAFNENKQRAYRDKNTLVFLLGLFLSSSVNASDFNEAVDKIFSRYVNERTPGCNVGAIKNGAFIHKVDYGLANMELDVPLDVSQIHRMASVSKQFRAMAALLLAGAATSAIKKSSITSCIERAGNVRNTKKRNN